MEAQELLAEEIGLALAIAPPPGRVNVEGVFGKHVTTSGEERLKAGFSPAHGAGQGISWSQFLRGKGQGRAKAFGLVKFSIGN